MVSRRAASAFGVVAAVVVAAAVIIAVSLLRVNGAPPAHHPPAAQPSTTPVAQQPPAVIIKIDNVAAARPHTGLAAADAVYVEPVEGGLTRLAAVYYTHLPSAVGPVRSARESDLLLFPQYGRPTFAYSGSVPELLPILHAAPFVNASPQEAPGAYYRDNSRPVPHNLYVHPDQLPQGGPGPEAVLQSGPAGPGGVPTPSQHVQYPAASYDFHWSAATGQWLVSMDGSPFVSTEAGQLGPTTVILQKISELPGHYKEDIFGAVAPIAQTVGDGSAVVLRDGQAFQATWSRPSPQAPTRYSTSTGQPLPVAPGQVWVLLVPA